MKKRILSVALALAVMLVSLPMLPISIGSINAGATAAPGDIDLNPLEWPTWADDVVINDFEGLTTDGSVTNENGTVYTGVGTAAPTNTSVSGLGYRDQHAAWGNRAGNVLTLDGHSLVDTLTAEAWFEFGVHMSTISGLEYGRQFPTANSKALKMKIDLTGVTSIAAGTKVRFELQQYISSGNSSGYTAYSEPGVTFYYLPDPTEENPNPEMQVLTSEGNNYHGRVWGYAGQSGTLILPLALWDTKGFANYGGNTTIYDIHKYTDGYRQRSYLTLQSEYYNYGVGDVFKLDYIGWLMDYPVNYEYKTVTQDFSTATSPATVTTPEIASSSPLFLPATDALFSLPVRPLPMALLCISPLMRSASGTKTTRPLPSILIFPRSAAATNSVSISTAETTMLPPFSVHGAVISTSLAKTAR